MAKQILSVKNNCGAPEVNLKVPSFQNFGARMGALERESFEVLIRISRLCLHPPHGNLHRMKFARPLFLLPLMFGLRALAQDPTPPGQAPAPIPSEAQAPAPSIAEDLLEARLENVRFDAKPPATVELMFVLKNRSEKESIHLSERWNSWGNLQWHFTAKTAAGQELGFVNSIDVWYRNFPSSFTIEPGKEFRCPCTLSLEGLSSPGTESRYRVCRYSEDPAPRAIDFVPTWTLPVKLTGHFSAVINRIDTGGFTNWKGKIKTEDVTVEKQNKE